MTHRYHASTAASINALTKRIMQDIMQDNLCKEIVLSPPRLCVLGYPKTAAALRRLMPKYQFSRAKWYVADFKWQDQHRAFEWCNQQFGVHPKRPDAWSRWKTMPGNQFAFRDQKDYNWFVLRWSS